MRFFNFLVVTFVLSSFFNVAAGGHAYAAGSSMKEDLDNGLIVCSLAADNVIRCNCKQGTQACSDMIRNTCKNGRAHCAEGYCTCEPKSSFLETNPGLQNEAVGGGTVVAPTESAPTLPSLRLQRIAPEGGTAVGN